MTPSISIVICSYNGAARIQLCLKSVMALDYPKHQIEIIVVDDGSEDETADIAKSFNVHVIRHDRNLGIPSARNSGLKSVNGEIIVYLDDDITVDKHWLKLVIAPFNDEKVLATSGQTLAYKTDTISERYLQAAGYGNPAPLINGARKDPISRFVTYLKSMFQPIGDVTKPVEVQAVYTANAAYRTQVLRNIGGFDESLFSNEDVDVSVRLLSTGGKLIYVPKATVKHRHHMRLSKFIRQTYTRSINTLHYYQKVGRTPPIFPLPILYILIVVATAYRDLRWIAVAVILSPLLLYSWWILTGLRRMKPELLLYPYIQLLLESTAIAGMVKGATQKFQITTLNKSPVSTRNLVLCTFVFSLLGVFVSAFVHNIIINFIFGTLAFLVVPGLLIQAILHGSMNFKLKSLLYGWGYSLAYWLLGGLAVNSLLPLFGFYRPLAPYSLYSFYLVSTVFLLAVFWVKYKHKSVEIRTVHWKKLDILTLALAVILPVVSVLGTQILNNYGSGHVTISMLIVMSGLVVALALNHKRISPQSYPIFIYGFSLALLLMYSMRGSFILGWDIHDEFRVFQTTLMNQRWQMLNYPGEAYNACLSVTILPTILQQLLHVSSEYIYKFVYQLIFAVTPVIVYAISKRFLTPVYSFLAAILFAAQTWFYEQMPALARQEIAMLFFALIILLLIDRELLKKRAAILYLFTVCLIVSHYSTAYIWLVIAVFAYMFLLISKIFIKKFRHVKFAITLTLVLSTFVLLYIWEGPLTNTLSHTQTVVSTGSGTLLDALSPKVIKQGVEQAFLAPPVVNTQQNLQRAYESAYLNREGGPEKYYSTKSYKDYHPTVFNDKKYAHSFFSKKVSKLINLGAYLVKAVVENIFTLIGVLYLMVALLRKKRIKDADFTFLSASAFLIIGLMLVLPYLQANYNVTRLFLQLFIILTIPALIGYQFVLKKVAKYSVLIISITIAIIFGARTGLIDQFTGGELRITMTQPNGTFDTFYVYRDEEQAAKWLSSNRDKKFPVYADSVAGLRLKSFADLDAVNDVFPATIPKQSYVYLIEANVKRKHAFYSYNNYTYSYSYPNQFLDQNKDLIYSSGNAKVYK